jgi:hypothetical protein
VYLQGAVSSLTALSSLDLSGCNATNVGLRAVSSLTSLRALNLSCCRNVTSEGLRAVIK